MVGGQVCWDSSRPVSFLVRIPELLLMPRFLIFFLLTHFSSQGITQDWLYAKGWSNKSSHELAKMKLVPADGGDPFFIVSRQEDFPAQHSWNWMSEEGGVLRLFSSDSATHDSALLISGQTRWSAHKDQNSWSIPIDDRSLLLRTMEEDSTIWLLEVILKPIEGVESNPEPILLFSLEPHSKKKNRFLIETTGNLQSIPIVLLELGISLALITTYSEPTVSE